MTPQFKAFLLVFVLGSCLGILALNAEADEGTSVYLGGWSYHAEGVGYDNQVHNTFGIEHNDWTAFTFVNSLNDRSYFFGKTTEDLKWKSKIGTTSLGVAYGCTLGYEDISEDGCLITILPKVTHDFTYVSLDLYAVPSIVYKLALRFPIDSLLKSGNSDLGGVSVARPKTSWAVGYSSSTIGHGISALYPLSRKWSAMMRYGTYDHTADNWELEVRSASLALDYHFWGTVESGAFISLGLVYNGSQAHYAVDGTYRGYDIEGTMDAEFNKRLSPYIGVGYQKIPSRVHDLGWRFDLGYHFPQGYKFESKLTSSQPLTPEIQELARETLQEEEERLLSQYPLDYYPTVSFGVYYTCDCFNF